MTASTPCLELVAEGGVFSGFPLYSFDFVMADPPWRFHTWSAAGEKKSASAHYLTMTLDEIKALPVRHLCVDDSLLWLWVTNPMLPQGLAVMEAWGFTYKTHGVWAKRTVNGRQAFGTGYVLRTAHETFLIGSRGKPKTARNVRSLFEGRVREHSRKPEAAYAVAEHLMPGARRLDLFSRQLRPGWTAFGNEIAKFSQVEG